MLCYAWDVLPQAELIKVSLAGDEKPVDLLARVLISGSHHLLRRGIDKGYVNVEDDLSTLRGRVDFAYSGRRGLLYQGKARCQFDELTADILPNQILKATLFRLGRANQLDSQLRKECTLLTKRFAEVSQITLNSGLFRRVAFHSNNRFYRFLINVCQLVFLEALLDQNKGEFHFRDFFRDDGCMPRLYEKFIFNFYRRNQSEYEVRSERIQWDAESVDDPGLSLLPTMLTDISLRSKQRTIIIDAKYYRETLTSFYGAKRIHSGNLYQINAYLQNIATNGGSDTNASGMLLYPTVNQSLSNAYEIGGKTVRLETVDLGSGWLEIEHHLLRLLH